VGGVGNLTLTLIHTLHIGLAKVSRVTERTSGFLYSSKFSVLRCCNLHLTTALTAVQGSPLRNAGSLAACHLRPYV
jgi:hypothetical protein